VVKPARFAPAKKYPVAFLIHGGPQGSFGDHFHYRWNPQTYAGAGYAVVMIDFHGSTGYGQAFTDAIRGDWGGKPLEDLQKGLAAALERYPWLDGERVCALGASYGGYMINWIAGNWPDRFRCLVNHDGIFDNRLDVLRDRGAVVPGVGARGRGTNPEGLREAQPLPRHEVEDADAGHPRRARLPRAVEQGLATFTALQRRGVPEPVAVLPGREPLGAQANNSIQWHQEVNAWLDRWLRDP
jgi:dipeptidyl aminopeptidase/acylaminoacyl peptidase